MRYQTVSLIALSLATGRRRTSHHAVITPRTAPAAPITARAEDGSPSGAEARAKSAQVALLVTPAETDRSKRAGKYRVTFLAKGAEGHRHTLPIVATLNDVLCPSWM